MTISEQAKKIRAALAGRTVYIEHNGKWVRVFAVKVSGRKLFGRVLWTAWREFTHWEVR